MEEFIGVLLAKIDTTVRQQKKVKEIKINLSKVLQMLIDKAKELHSDISLSEQNGLYKLQISPNGNIGVQSVASNYPTLIRERGRFVEGNFSSYADIIARLLARQDLIIEHY